MHAFFAAFSAVVLFSVLLAASAWCDALAMVAREARRATELIILMREILSRLEKDNE
jgi:hypothetical protein